MEALEMKSEELSFNDKFIAFLNERILFAHVRTKDQVYNKIKEIVPYCDVIINPCETFGKDVVYFSFGQTELCLDFYWVKQYENDSTMYWLNSIENDEYFVSKNTKTTK